jgi:hypothetical protein
MKHLLLGIGLLCLASPVFCEEEKVFTNEDLFKYRTESGVTVYPARVTTEGKKESGKEKTKRDTSEQKRKDYYCSQGVKYKRALDEAEHSLQRCQDKFYEKRKASHFLISEGRGDCDQKKRALQRARETHRDLADKARRENIPDGWLRCQFE